MQRIAASFYRQAEQSFASGTKIGEGGEGEVRRVEWDSAAYAIKRSQRISPTYQSELGSTVWVQVPLARHLTLGDDETGAGDNAYDLLPLAAGDLWHSALGRQAALAACGQSTMDTQGGVAQHPDMLTPLWSEAEFAAIAAETLVAAYACSRTPACRH